MSEYDVDPANGTERYDDGSAGTAAEPSSERFTAPDKIASVARAVLSRPSGDPKVSALLAVITSGLGRRMVLDPALSMLPPMDDPGAWDGWLAMLAGCALELTSDGVEPDVAQCRENARQVLAALFEGA